MRTAFLLVLGGVATLLGGCGSAPITGRSQIMLVSESQERQMGLQAYRQVLSTEQPSHDAQATALIEKVGRRIAQAAEHPPDNMWKAPNFRWEFKLIQKEVPNAFCLPGGKVAVNSGLLPISETEAGLAVVIGHEVAHALARHGAERVSDGIVASVGLAAASAVLSSTASGSSRTYLPLTIAALGAGASIGFLLPMSRAQESEADRIGLVLMALAGYDPQEGVGLWQRMRAASGGRGKAEWLSTHPANQTRLEDIRRWVPEAMKHYRKHD